MEITIQLPADLEQAARSRAVKNGVTVETVVLCALRNDFMTTTANGEQTGAKQDSGLETSEALLPDTQRASTVTEMSHAWQNLTKPLAQDEWPLSVDPDNYPLF